MRYLLLAATTLAAVTLAPPTRADPSSADVEKARTRWFSEAGFDDHFGLRPEDRPKANDAIEQLNKTQPQIELAPGGTTHSWLLRRRLDEPGQRCAIAAVVDALNQWHRFVAVGLAHRPFMVSLDCSGGWARVTLEPASTPGAFDVFKLEAGHSTLGEASIIGSAPWRLSASDVALTPDLPHGAAYEVLLLAHQSLRELSKTSSPLSGRLRTDVERLPQTALSCIESPRFLPNITQLCATRMDTDDLRNLTTTAVLRYLEFVHRAWESGASRDQPPPIAVLLHGNKNQWAMARTGDSGDLELEYSDGYKPHMIQTPVPRRFLESTPTLPAPDRAPTAPTSAKTADARLSWLGAHAASIYFTLTGDVDKLKSGSLELPRLLAALGPSGGKDGWARCTPRRGKEVKHCTLTPRLPAAEPECGPLGCDEGESSWGEFDLPTCRTIAWALAAGVPHTDDAAWTAKEEVVLHLPCGMDPDASESVRLRLKPGGQNRLLVTFEDIFGDPRLFPLLAPADPARPL